MSAGSRALMLIVPLVAFALGGAWYAPNLEPIAGSDDESGSEVQYSGLPPLPDWASAPLPDFSRYRDTTEKKAAFFSFLYPRIVLANSRILLERDYLLSLENKPSLSPEDAKWLDTQARRLRVDGETGSPAQIALLKKRLDIIPPSLIMAQAANESAWGTSRFATKGNNLFGQWCFSKGCGLVPQGRIEGATHEVARFSSPYRSVRAYIQNLNRHPTYQLLREIRQTDRHGNDPLSGIDMAEGLLGYSERGADYVEEIRAMIHYNNLEFYDQDFRQIVQDRRLPHLLELASTPQESSLLPGRAVQESDLTEG